MMECIIFALAVTGLLLMYIVVCGAGAKRLEVEGSRIFAKLCFSAISPNIFVGNFSKDNHTCSRLCTLWSSADTDASKTYWEGEFGGHNTYDCNPRGNSGALFSTRGEVTRIKPFKSHAEGGDGGHSKFSQYY